VTGGTGSTVRPAGATGWSRGCAVLSDPRLSHAEARRSTRSSVRCRFRKIGINDLRLSTPGTAHAAGSARHQHSDRDGQGRAHDDPARILRQPRRVPSPLRPVHLPCSKQARSVGRDGLVKLISRRTNIHTGALRLSHAPQRNRRVSNINYIAQPNSYPEWAIVWSRSTFHTSEADVWARGPIGGTRLSVEELGVSWRLAVHLRAEATGRTRTRKRPALSPLVERLVTSFHEEVWSQYQRKGQGEHQGEPRVLFLG
jgi:hypothetical protein